ncbi:peroxisome biogenesis protein 5 isoform X2 [Gossypium hirsutum]|uniref:Peroxisome biogenesis protein 5 isoform X2 n=1 Tax=Gossypium hirsutum TaxID=3635 RepID=A0ABM2Z0W6_GOSHI|nr:peroxisome biogenesis protein 5 isoform X2 [Gossypium hirsutum]XP_040936331.1 peroxisome biogenesis protein 5 isoform X2 [Gossypium hirsutum]XP_040936332.1 peroxisome biogenesis protein 5 isoform X2 [Gossypium hirsutum]XP_040936333.1 peroxisome biogenesis protein 5 isoform X2 [Gossypium hirsutum]
MSELRQHGGKIALANKILIPGIAGRKFPAVDVIRFVVLAFRDIAPQAPTHVLIIPKSKDGLSALDLKPNYVRAWANMGISYTNQGMYEESIRYYVRALAMNPKADNAWQYLRTSLSCVSRNNMVEACDSRNLELLQEFPL